MVNLEVLTNSEEIVKTQERKILRVNEHVDGGWFWSKYSASPYLGCKFGCSYCFLRQEHYGLSARKAGGEHHGDPFSEIVVPIENAPELLNNELASVKPDVIIVGDYQPIEKRFQLSRQMLEVCSKHNFPCVVITRSPLVVRDADIIKRGSDEAGVAVVFSIGYHSSGYYRQVFESTSPSIESRFDAMEKLSQKGIYTGTAAIPIFPFLTDDDANLEGIVRKTKEHGGEFVMAGGLVLDNGQKEKFYKRLRSLDPSLVEKYEQLYGESFSPRDNSWAFLGRRIKDLCIKYGIEYRMKRLIPETELAANKRLAEKLFLHVYEMELEEFGSDKIEQIKKLAFFVDELTKPASEPLIALSEQRIFNSTRL